MGFASQRRYFMSVSDVQALNQRMDMEDGVEKRPRIAPPKQAIRPKRERKDDLVDLLFGEVDLEKFFGADEPDEVAQRRTVTPSFRVHH